MKPTLARFIAVVLISIIGVSPAWATCGGGGGGGDGGMSSGGGGANPVVYHVPWHSRAID